MTYVPPSSLLSIKQSKSLGSFNKRFKNTPLRVGVITECYETDDEKNVTKLVPEYTVVTSEQDSDSGGASFKTYKNCLSTDGFGGIADFFEYKLRPTKQVFDKKEGDKKVSHDFTKQNGSTVLIMCLDGFSEKAIIVGGLPNLTTENERKSTLTKGNELHLEGEYNGLNWQINKDGEFTVTFKSKTDNDGKPQDDKAGGAFAKIDKTGSIELDTADEAFLKLDKPAKDIIANAGNNISMTAKKDIEATADGNIKGMAKADIEFLAEGSAKYSAKSALDIECDGPIKMKGSTISFTADRKVKVTAASVLVSAPQIKLGDAGLPALIPTTKWLGIGFLGWPVLSIPIGPFSTSVQISP
jgi:hypothetical protein